MLCKLLSVLSEEIINYDLTLTGCDQDHYTNQKFFFAQLLKVCSIVKIYVISTTVTMKVKQT